MKTALAVLLALVVGALAARAFWTREPEPVDPLQIIVTQVRTHAIIEHEREVAIWYRVCPEVVGINPQIFVAWPAKLSYELELADVQIRREGTTLQVSTRGIRADEPAVPTDFMDYLSTSSIFSFASEHELVNREVMKASVIARYLSAYFLKRDPSLRADFARELQGLVTRLAGALGVQPTEVKVTIPEETATLPKLPALELCEHSMASVNGLPFARLEDGYTVPIGFRPAPSVRSGVTSGATPGAPPTTPQGIASVYGAPR